ncbi:MazG family protein [Cellulomonas oligotrophica]|uniref:XTP/dITP diphosphohydrolase n=1 Tax=Cellulomonas oligotrophica TaxID=931536 RepID=A0A7Y9FHR9_9CELL|nr:MazG family protein [Cellulomonas oligotrophica]NYD87464.1 XTP/dITP diphosphohydrolase [Cellulomonas oligotrophica]GIG34057.1 hypothetical protein Col01nite_32160 [Cellulomonas oligotrophica]
MTAPTPDRPGGSSAVRDGAGVARLVAVMDRLRSPGGCPWDAQQTHESLLPYALEEVHELVEAVEHGDRDDLREELGDVLLQVVFHARLAQEHPQDPFDLDAVAAGVADKLVRRHPHVFGAEQAPPVDGPAPAVDDVDGQHRRWDRLKRAEKPGRTSALDGVPATLGALARSQKLASRARRAGLDVTAGARSEVRPGRLPDGSLPGVAAVGADDVGERLLAIVLEADARGVDAEGALRRASAAWEQRLRSAEVVGAAGAPERLASERRGAGRSGADAL